MVDRGVCIQLEAWLFVIVNKDIFRIFDILMGFFLSIIKNIPTGTGPDPTKPACKKAKQLRLEKYLLKNKNTVSITDTSVEVTVNTFLFS